MHFLKFPVKFAAIFSALLLVSIVLFCALAVYAARIDMPADLPQVDNHQAMVIDAVSIVDVENGALRANSQILIQDGVIAEIRAAGSTPPANARLIDGRGLFVVPGLTDMHTHIHDRKDLVTSLVYGVTTVRNLRGMPMHLRWRDEVNKKQWLGATMITSSPVLDRPEHAHLMQQRVTSPAHARKLVRVFSDRGYDLLKVYSDLDATILSAITDEARKRGMPIAKHGPYGALPDGAQAFDLQAVHAIQSFEHVEEIFQTVLGFDYDQDKLEQFITQLKRSDTPITPTLATFDHLTQLSAHKQDYVERQATHQINPFFGYLNKKYAVDRWLNADQAQVDWNLNERAALLKITKALADNQIPMLVGSDHGTMMMTAGVSMHREMILMQEAGISPANIVKSATLNAARAMNRQHRMGSISVNKVADLVLVKRNPLENVKHLNQPVAVIKNGQWLGESELKQLIASGDHPSHWYPSLGRFLEDILQRAFL